MADMAQPNEDRRRKRQRLEIGSAALAERLVHKCSRPSGPITTAAPPSPMLGRLQAFLPQLASANAQLAQAMVTDPTRFTLDLVEEADRATDSEGSGEEGSGAAVPNPCRATGAGPRLRRRGADLVAPRVNGYADGRVNHVGLDAGHGQGRADGPRLPDGETSDEEGPCSGSEDGECSGPLVVMDLACGLLDLKSPESIAAAERIAAAVGDGSEDSSGSDTEESDEENAGTGNSVEEGVDTGKEIPRAHLCSDPGPASGRIRSGKTQFRAGIQEL